jgi:D-galactarolactone cycloisomerase
MKIRDVNTYRLEAALVEPFAYSQAWYERRGALLVEIVGDDGLSGWGEAFGPPVLTAPIVEFYKSLLVNAGAFATELHWQNLYNRLRDRARLGSARGLRRLFARAGAGNTLPHARQHDRRL